MSAGQKKQSESQRAEAERRRPFEPVRSEGEERRAHLQPQPPEEMSEEEMARIEERADRKLRMAAMSMVLLSNAHMLETFAEYQKTLKALTAQWLALPPFSPEKLPIEAEQQKIRDEMDRQHALALEQFKGMKGQAARDKTKEED